MRLGAILFLEVNAMTKSLITKTWIAGLAVFAGGILVAIVGVFLMLAYGGTFTQVAGNPNNYNFTPNLNGFFWTTVGLMATGGVIALIGSIVQLAAWIGGLVNSYMLPDKTWFLILLLGGLASFFLALIGFAVMVAYVIAAPDGTVYRTHVPAPTQQPRPLAPTT
jgi:hypothetical protein